MENKKKYVILLFILIVLIIIFSVVIYFSRREEKLDVLLIGNSKESVEDNNTQDENNDEDDVINSDSDNDNTDVGTSSDKQDTYLEDKTKEDTNNSNTSNYTEEDVVSYFSDMETEVDSSSSFKEKFKEYFVLVVDFIFYDKEIKGYTFDELSGTAKAKIISVALKIDSKIEEYVPGYKETISSTSSKVYTNIKGKLVTLYMDISTDICKDNESECNKVKEIFSDIKDACSIGWEFIKGLISSGGTKIKEWYEIYSGK